MLKEKENDYYINTKVKIKDRIQRKRYSEEEEITTKRFDFIFTLDDVSGGGDGTCHLEERYS